MTARTKHPTSSISGASPIACSPAPAATGAGTFFTPPNVAEALAALLWPRINDLSYGWKAPDGSKPQTSRQQLDRTFAAFWRQKYGGEKPQWWGTANALTLQKLTHAIVAGNDLYFRGAWNSRFLLVRFDIDAHHGETDVETLRAWASKLLGDNIYWCRSERGWSGYFWLVGHRDHRHANETVAALHIALGAMAKAGGFAAGIEAKGSYLLTEQPWERGANMPDGPRRVSEDGMRGTLAKMPRCQTMEDVARLRGAVIQVHDIERIIRTAPAPSPKPAPKRRETRAERERRWAALDEVDGADHARDGRRIPPSPDAGKPELAFWVVAEAAIRLGVRTDEDADERDRITELAHDIYDECQFSSNSRDRERESRIAGAYRVWRRTFDPSKAGKGGSSEIWFTTRDDGKQNDVDAFLSHARGAGLRRMIDEANVWLRSRRHPVITEECVGIVAVTMAKNAESNEAGDCPVDALLGRRLPGGKRAKGMLAHHGIRADGSTVCRAMKIVQALGAIGCIRDAKQGVCRAYSVLRSHWFHFLAGAGEALARLREKAKQVRAAREAFEAGGHTHFSLATYGDDNPSADEFEWADHIGECECDVDSDMVFADFTR